MHSIPMTRYSQPKSLRDREQKRCSDLYVQVKRQQRRVEAEHQKEVLVVNSAFALASAHFRSGVVLRRINLFTLASDQFDRAYQLLALF